MFKSQRVRELECLICHLKNDKKSVISAALKSLRSTIESEALGIVEFMCRDEGGLARNPYMFVDRRGKILGYTKAFEVALNLQEEVRGKNYLDVFYGSNDNPDVKRELRKYFSGLEEVTAPYTVQDKKRTRDITLIKEKPIYKRNIDVSFMKLKDSSYSQSESREDLEPKTVQAISYIPIRVESRKTNGVNIFKGPKNVRKETQQKFIDASFKLLMHYGWNSNEIKKYQEDWGRNGLIAKFEELENNPKDSDPSSDKL